MTENLNVAITKVRMLALLKCGKFSQIANFNAEGTQLHKDAKEMEVVLNQLLGNVSNRRRFTTYKMPQDDYIWCTDVLYKVRIHHWRDPSPHR